MTRLTFAFVFELAFALALAACAGSAAPHSQPAVAAAPDARLPDDAPALAACPAGAIVLSNRRCSLQPSCTDGEVTCVCSPECHPPHGRPGIHIERIDVWHCGEDRCGR